MELSGRQIQEHRFTSAWLGYNRGKVDVFLANCGSQMSALEERLRIAEVRAEKSEKELASIRAVADDLLEDATQARRTIIEEARAEAMKIASQSRSVTGQEKLADAVTEAAAIISEAETAASLRLDEIGHIRTAAEADAVAIVRNAEETAAMTEAEAERLLDKARMDANSMREESESVRASMDTQLGEIREILEAVRAGWMNIDDLASRGLLSGSDPDLIVDLTDEKAAARPSGTGDERSSQS